MEAPDTVALSVSRYQVSARGALPMSVNAQLTLVVLYSESLEESVK